MKIKTFSTTIVTDVTVSYDIKEALAKKFKCEVGYAQDVGGYALSIDSSQVKNFEQDFIKVVNDTEAKSKKAEGIKINENRRAMDAWKFPKLNKVTCKTCNIEVVVDLLRVCTVLGSDALVEYAKGNHSMAWYYARDCKDVALVHNLYVSGKFHQAAKFLRSLDTAVREYVNSDPYREIMKSFPRLTK